MSEKIVLATTNQGKLREIHELMGDSPATLTTMDAAGFTDEIEEDGDTFEANALIKARAVFEAVGPGCIVIADDSGLEVDALGGAPGVKSARYGGEGANDGDKRKKLLAELAGVRREDRSARFVTAAAAVWAGGAIVAHGTCEGQIGFEESGSNGFGYDSIFYIPGLRKTMADLESDEKNAISARGNAFRALLKLMRDGGVEI